jgi:methylmalonyl-CoA/ethylmalonyl-CoA epimerase
MLSGKTANLNLRFHHVGIVVKDIERSVEDCVQRFGYELRSGIIHDPMQTARVQFLSFPGEQVFLEFVSPDGPDSFLALALKKGGGLNHICYSTGDIDEACQQLRNDGLFLVRAPTEAVAFNGRKIAWLMGRGGILVELVERGPENEL